MKITVLDGYTTNPGDIDWSPISSLCDLTVYDRTPQDLIIERIQGCDGFFVNKCKITVEILKSCPEVKFIGVLATGYDNVDVSYAKEQGIAVCNVPAYSTDAVAQHTFALILALTNHIADYNKRTQQGEWYKSEDFTFVGEPLNLLNGKSLGIVGYGNIGKKVAEIAEAFGMQVNIYSRNKEATKKSDFLTLHCPLTEENRMFINKEFISKMKDGAVIINTARGGLINPDDLAEALKSGKIAAAGIDVLPVEPPKEPSPLIGLPNCIITPHIAWMTQDTRQRIINISADSLRGFIEERPVNRVDL